MRYTMRRCLFTLVLSLLACAASVSAQIPAQMLAQQEAAKATPTTKPADAATPAAEHPDHAETIGEVLAKTRLGELAMGKRKVGIEDLENPLFWVDTVQNLAWAIIGFIPRFLVALLFLVIFWLIYRALRRVILGSMRRAHVDESIRDMLGYLLKWTIMGFGLVVAGNQIGVQIAALLTAAGVIGLAVGFAAQETLANFIAGIVIFWDKPFKVGDWIDISDTFGQVQRITFRSTRLLDLNGQIVIHPNTHMLSLKVSNHTTHPMTRVNVPIGIAYKESIDQARAVLLATTKGDDRVYQTPAPEVVVAQCADSSVNLLFRFWIRYESQEKQLIFEYLEKAKKALDAANIQIPYPHMQVFMEETPAIDTLASGAMRKAG